MRGAPGLSAGQGFMYSLFYSRSRQLIGPQIEFDSCFGGGQCWKAKAPKGSDMLRRLRQSPAACSFTALRPGAAAQRALEGRECSAQCGS